MTEGPSVVWVGHPWAPAPLGAIRRARRQDPSVRVVDDAGREVPFGAMVALREFGRGLWQRGLDTVLAALVGLTVRRRSPPRREAEPGPGPVVLVVPVLPDLSHTFVYREVLAILQQRPEWRVLVLARNERAPRHAEATALLERAEFLPREGPTRRALRQLAWLLRARGRELFALYRAQAGSTVRDLLGRHVARDASHPAQAFLLADHLASRRPRALHVYSSTWPANVVMGAAHLLGAPFSISSYVDFEFPYALPLLAEKVQRARFFRVVTDYCRQQLRAQPGLRELPDAQVPVVLLGLDLAAWRETAPLAGRGVLVSAARLVPKKGLHLMPAALAQLRAAGVPCRWRVLGDGPEWPRIAAACAQHGVADLVDWLGACDSDTVRRELLAADAAVLPCVVAHDGERDGIPVFLCEALALGVPVVSTPVSGIPELVVDGSTGLLATPGDATSLAGCLQRVLGDARLARALAANGRAAVQAQLDVHQRARDLVACIER